MSLSTLQTIYAETIRVINTATPQVAETSLLSLSNLTYLDMQRQMAKKRIDAFGGTSVAIDLTAGVEYYSITANLPNMLALLRAEINYTDSTSDRNYIKMTQMDLVSLPMPWRGFLLQQSLVVPFFDQYGGSFNVAPRPQTTSQAQAKGLLIWFIQKQADFTGPNSTVPYPLDQHVETFSWGNAWRYYEPYNQELADKYHEQYQNQVNTMISMLMDESEEPIKTIPIDYSSAGWQ